VAFSCELKTGGIMNLYAGVVLAALLGTGTVKAEASLNSEPKIRIFGLSKDGQTRSYSISEKVFRYSFGRGLERLHRKALTNIDKFKQTSKDFKMTRVTVGLKIEAEFAVGNALELGAESAFDLRYQPLPKPTPSSFVLRSL
jgi:hypothetical protein